MKFGGLRIHAIECLTDLLCSKAARSEMGDLRLDPDSAILDNEGHVAGQPGEACCLAGTVTVPSPRAPVFLGWRIRTLGSTRHENVHTISDPIRCAFSEFRAKRDQAPTWDRVHDLFGEKAPVGFPKRRQVCPFERPVQRSPKPLQNIPVAWSPLPEWFRPAPAKEIRNSIGNTYSAFPSSEGKNVPTPSPPPSDKEWRCCRRGSNGKRTSSAPPDPVEW